MSASSTPTLWSLRAWRLAFPAAVISRLGDFVFDTTVILWISTELAKGESWAPSAVSGVLIAAVLPVLLVGPIAGVFCDRHDRHRILMWSNLVQGASIGSLLLVTPLGGVLGTAGQLSWIYLAIALTSAAGQFFGTARMVMVHRTIPDALLTKAFATQGGANNVVAMIGPPLAAPLLFAAGVKWALLLNAASYLVSSGMLNAVRWDSCPTGTIEQESFLQSFGAGLKVVRSNRLIVALLAAVTVATLGTGIINTLEVFFVTEVLHTPASWLGLLGTCMAGGTVLGMAMATRAERVLSAPRTFLYGLAAVGLLVTVFSRSTTFWFAAIVYVASAIPLGALNAVTSPLIMRAVSPEVLGRVIAVIQMLPTLASLCSMAVAGWLASTVLRGVDFSVAGSHFGPIDSLFAVAGVMMLVAAALVWRPIMSESADRAEERATTQSGQLVAEVDGVPDGAA